MCSVDTPNVVPARSAARAPDAATTANRTEDALRRRQSIGSMILTNQAQLGAAPTAGKPVLGG